MKDVRKIEEACQQVLRRADRFQAAARRTQLGLVPRPEELKAYVSSQREYLQKLKESVENALKQLDES
jgi:hypothetical protein